MRMLIATDGDLVSDVVREMAREIALRLSIAELHVLRALDADWVEEITSAELLADGSGETDTAGHLAKLICEDERDALKELCSRALGHAPAHCHVRVAKDLVAATAELARELDADLIVMESVSTYGASRWRTDRLSTVRWLGT